MLLLAVLRGMGEGWICENRIELSPELAGAFKSIWQNLVTTAHSPLIAQPFFYMRSEMFWHHVPNPGYENWVKVTRNCQSIGVLHQAVAYAQLDPDLFMLAMSPTHRAALRQALLETYFPHAQPFAAESSGYWDQVTHQILAESSAVYQAGIRKLQEQLDKVGPSGACPGERAPNLDKTLGFDYIFPHETALQNDLPGREPQSPEKRFPITWPKWGRWQSGELKEKRLVIMPEGGHQDKKGSNTCELVSLQVLTLFAQK